MTRYKATSLDTQLWRSIVFFAATFGFVLILSSPSAWADQQSRESAKFDLEKWEEKGEQYRIVREQLEIISEELKQPDLDPLWGRYEMTAGLSGPPATITISPISGFAYIDGGCYGPSDFNYGEAVLDGNSLQLKFNLTHSEHIRAPSSDMTVIRWGPRTFLVPESRMIDFCNAVNAGKQGWRDDQFRDFFTKVASSEESAKRFPDVPEEYRKYLLREPIQASFIEAVEGEAQPEPIEFTDANGDVVKIPPDRRVYESDPEILFCIDVGEDDGVLPGMTFHAKSGTTVRVIRTAERTAVVEPVPILLLWEKRWRLPFPEEELSTERW